MVFGISESWNPSLYYMYDNGRFTGCRDEENEMSIPAENGQCDLEPPAAAPVRASAINNLDLYALAALVSLFGCNVHSPNPIPDSGVIEVPPVEPPFDAGIVDGDMQTDACPEGYNCIDDGGGVVGGDAEAPIYYPPIDPRGIRFIPVLVGEDGNFQTLAEDRFSALLAGRLAYRMESPIDLTPEICEGYTIQVEIGNDSTAIDVNGDGVPAAFGDTPDIPFCTGDMINPSQVSEEEAALYGVAREDLACPTEPYRSLYMRNCPDDAANRIIMSFSAAGLEQLRRISGDDPTYVRLASIESTEAAGTRIFGLCGDPATPEAGALPLASMQIPQEWCETPDTFFSFYFRPAIDLTSYVDETAPIVIPRGILRFIPQEPINGEE